MYPNSPIWPAHTWRLAPVEAECTMCPPRNALGRQARGRRLQEVVGQDHPGRPAIDVEDRAGIRTQRSPAQRRRPPPRRSIPLVSAKWRTFSKFAQGRGLTSFSPEQETPALGTNRTQSRLSTQLRYHSWIIARFHVPTRP